MVIEHQTKCGASLRVQPEATAQVPCMELALLAGNVGENSVCGVSVCVCVCVCVCV